jgi:hypothetical protein
MKRRFVVGLREVARSVKVSQIKLIILATDIEESSAPGTCSSPPCLIKLTRLQKVLTIASQKSLKERVK